MAETDNEYTPEHASGAPRRGFFRRPENPAQDPSMTSEERRVAEALQRTIDERMEQGLRQLEQQADRPDARDRLARCGAPAAATRAPSRSASCRCSRATRRCAA